MSKLRAATVLAAAVVALLAFATPASATIDTWYRWGETEHDYYHYGNSSLGEFDTSVWVDELERDYDEDGIPDADFIRGHARNCKVRGVLRSQVDYVRLGNATQGGVLAELYALGSPIVREDTAEGVLIRAHLPHALAERYASFRLVPTGA